MIAQGSKPSESPKPSPSHSTGSQVGSYPGLLPGIPPNGQPSPETMQAVLERCGARLTDGHFLLTSGRHSDRFYLLPLVLQHPKAVRFLARCLASQARSQLDLTGLYAVVGPAMGGVLLAHELALALDVRALYAEKEPDGTMRLKRGFRLPSHARVLVAEDAVTTGGSVQKTITAIQDQDGDALAAMAVVHRSAAAPDLGIQLFTLLHDPVSDWAPQDCPLCAAGRPLTRPKS